MGSETGRSCIIICGCGFFLTGIPALPFKGSSTGLGRMVINRVTVKSGFLFTFNTIFLLPGVLKLVDTFRSLLYTSLLSSKYHSHELDDEEASENVTVS